jgi:UDP-N-acetylmuramoyl-tripeptide--D-alanyl-D-alanine ligase
LANLGLKAARGRRIAALTDMLELGPESPAHHAGLAGAIEAAGVDLVFCAGPLMKSLFDALPAARRGAYAESADQLLPVLAEAVGPGDVVMVKGSRDSRAALLVEGFAALDHAAREGR